jgi:hypothetical protein
MTGYQCSEAKTYQHVQISSTLHELTAEPPPRVHRDPARKQERERHSDHHGEQLLTRVESPGG